MTRTHRFDTAIVALLTIAAYGQPMRAQTPLSGLSLEELGNVVVTDVGLPILGRSLSARPHAVSLQ